MKIMTFEIDLKKYEDPLRVGNFILLIMNVDVNYLGPCNIFEYEDEDDDFGSC